MTNFEKYFISLQSHKIDEITEQSHRPALKDLLESIAGSKVKILHEPRREGKFGSPDFKVTHTESIIGYIENKPLKENLDKVLKSEQIKKYQSLSDNILLTNYVEWIWIKEGKILKRETLCYVTDVENKRAKLSDDKIETVTRLIKSFLSQAPKQIGDAKVLAEALAVRAKLLKDFLLDELEHQETEHSEGRLYQLYETFKTFIFHELTVSEFSDAFAQNLVYGLFLAKLNADVKPVNLNNAWDYIPSTFELIKELVDFLKELKRDEYRETKWIVEEVLTIMNNLDLKAIHETLSFSKRKKEEETYDPYIYLYEKFLAAYDKKLREAKGVYYTPPQVVNFIIRAIDDILVNTFNIKDGLGDRNKVTVLDFATGTGTFLVEVLQKIFDKLPKGSGKKDLIIKEHILKNIYGFEYLIAPYTIAHLKLSQFLKDNGYELQPKERLQIYLTNTLEPIVPQIKISLLPALTEESNNAQEVKKKPILVITGNPPYAYESKNPSKIYWTEEVITLQGTRQVKRSKMTWIGEKIEAYKFVDSKKIKEKNSKGLQDDYVKFIRFAQDKMDKVEEGIVGIITNHSFLDNPTFNGMRQSLIKSFDQIYFIDLHGNAKKKERTPKGDKDENVFDIEQGVAISLFIKKKGISKKILQTDFWGSRADKYKLSLETDITDIKWKILEPHSPFYLFKEQDSPKSKTYQKNWKITDIFKLTGVGVATSRDSLCIHFNKIDLFKRIKRFFSLSDEDDRKEFDLGPDTEDWKIELAKEDLEKSKLNEKLIIPYLYRPFDFRFTYYTGKSKGFISRPRREIMSHILKGNLALFVGRQGQATGDEEWNVIFCGNVVEDYNLFRRGNNACLPFYLYDEENLEKKEVKEENFSDEFRKYIKKIYKTHILPEEIFSYIYAILHSPTYRSKYAEFLQIDFPRIPFIEGKKIFKQLTELGSELIKVHLVKKTDLPYDYGHLIGKGDYIVQKPQFEKGRLFINKSQYFDNVPKQVYEFYIGGYQVLDKYLKDRKERNIMHDIDHIEQVIKALAFTIDQMKKIDKLTKKWI